MKSERVFKRAFNDALEFLSRCQPGEALPPELALSRHLRVSRTTVRKILSALEEKDILKSEGRERHLATTELGQFRFPPAETVSMLAQVERQFMEWMLRDDAKPGTLINELDLARKFGVTTTAIREFLIRFHHFGLIEKRPNAGWLFKGFTTDFAMELFEIREMFELRSARAFALLPADAPLRWQLDSLRQEHLDLQAAIDERFHDFSDLDNRFHRLINSAAPNRFIDDFYDIISIIFHYHYQWKKHDERARNEVAIQEHLAYIQALQDRDIRSVDRTCRLHLSSAKKTLIQATLS